MLIIIYSFILSKRTIHIAYEDEEIFGAYRMPHMICRIWYVTNDITCRSLEWTRMTFGEGQGIHERATIISMTCTLKNKVKLKVNLMTLILPDG